MKTFHQLGALALVVAALGVLSGCPDAIAEGKAQMNGARSEQQADLEKNKPPE